MLGAPPAAASAAIAMPGDAIHAFWLALTTRSTPHASISNGHRAEAADAVDEQERLAGRPAHDLGQRRIGFATPVEVSLWVTSTAR